ncbi:XRE family transcriptional regulator [Actinomadura sp. KC216]|uniref:helix-turn-helix domain-containing protein n=1 Tax=Actinomadura sp. KC216 TaxID=2530370 RepID=UPI00104B005B|nr:helix-turn-helix transcriptional regulator [Actinomadura sp. KC216]TDB83375.1 XRE family transcriptional regulator [Actinomadura sp. KC216]
MDSLREWLTQPEGLATRLRAMRAHAGLTGKDLADAHGWQQSKVSRIENGKQMPSDEDLQAWAETCGDRNAVGELLRLRDEAQAAHVTFRSRMRQGQEQVQEDYNKLVMDSRLIRHFETVYVPGLLQIPAYARRVLREMISLHNLEIDDVDAAVAARLQRQQLLYDTSKRFEFLLAEPVLRWLICPPPVMRSQLDRLQTIIGLDRVRFGILPMGVELATTPQNSFQIYTADQAVVALETFVGEDFARSEGAAHYERVMDLLWEEAVTGDEARELIVAAAQQLD